MTSLQATTTASWIVANTPFDRLYFYGDDLPIHVSHGPNQDRQIVMMSAGKAGRLVPRVVPSLPDARSPRLV